MRTMREGVFTPCPGPVARAASTVLTPARTSSSSALLVTVLITAALIVLRSLVFLQYEHADFDADQAIVGLMAHHLSEGRAWPLLFYGQLYMMGVQAWLAAPVFLWLGPSVFALKLPLLAINVATGVLLVWLMVRDAGLRAWQAGVATAWFALLPPVTASRMVQAQGGTIEPLFYGLLLWMLRRRAIAFGLLFAFGFLQREFTLFAVLGILALDVGTGELFSRRRLAHWMVVLLVFLGAREAVTLLRHTASMFGPDTAPPRLEDGVTNVDVMARSVCLTPGHIAANVTWLAGHNVPVFFGARTEPAGVLINTARPTGWGGAAVPLVAALAIAGVIVGLAGWRWVPLGRAPADPRVLLPCLLVVTGIFGLVGIATGCNVQSLISIRYHLLLALAPVGLTALAFVLASPRETDATRPRRRPLLRAMTGSLALWAIAMAWQHGRLLEEYRTSPPPNVYRRLVDDLVAHGDRYGWASYWVSYHVDFLSAERVQLSPTSAIRITEYARQALKAGPRATVVGTLPCDPTDVARKVEGWWICRKP